MDGRGAGTSEVVTLFDQLDALTVTSKDSAKSLKKQQEVFLKAMEDVLSKFATYLNNGFELSRIFYQRMIDSQSVLPSEKLVSYALLMESYRSLSKKKNMELFNVSQIITNYYNTHKLDPDNSLIGLTISARAAQACLLEEKDKEASIGKGKSASNRRTILEGELVLVEPELGNYNPDQPPWRYGRIATTVQENDELALVFFSPHEKSKESVKIKLIRPVSQMIVKSLGQPKMMQRLVADPFEDFFTSMHDELKVLTRNYLRNLRMDVELLDEVITRPNINLPISALFRLTTLHHQLQNLNNNPIVLSTFYDEVNQFAEEKISNFVAAIVDENIFLPMKNANIQHLEGFKLAPVAANRLLTAFGRCDACMDTMRIMMKEMTNGLAKRKLTEWWLSRIETETNAFLKSKRYQMNVYPADYLQSPPENIQPVKFNLELIREILNPLDDKHGTKELINRLKLEIYPRIDEFIAAALIVMNQVDSSIPISTTSPSIEELQKLINACTAEPETKAWMSELVKDLKYLARMKELETSSEKVLDVVPVSGLVLSQFYRLENELRTVIELWDGYLQEKLQNKGERAYERLKTKIHLWKLSENKIEVMKEFGGTSCIMQLQTGGFFSAALTEHGEVYTWGKGLSGELGVGEKKKITEEPVLVESLKEKKVVQIACGGALCAAVTAEGELYLWGFFGVNSASMFYPNLVDAENFANVKIRQVALSSSHILVLLDTGDVYSWGKNNKGQLGLGNLKDREKPCLVDGLKNKKIKTLRAGEEISAAISEQGDVYLWGRNDDAFLGTSVTQVEYASEPSRLQIVSRPLKDLVIGSRLFCGLFDSGEVCVWGYDVEFAYITPAEVSGRIVKIACGQSHIVICTDSDIYTHKVVKLSTTREAMKQRSTTATPSKRDLIHMEELHGKNILQISCGSQHTAALVENPAFFGVPLSQVMNREKGRRVPSMVQKICTYLHNKLKTEGLFKYSGKFIDLKKDFDRDEDVNLFRCKDPHAVAALLKEYLRMLPEPLIPDDRVEAFLALEDGSLYQTQVRSSPEENTRVLQLYTLIHKLPTHEAELVKYLLGFLHQVAQNVDQNKMGAQQLGVNLAPLFFRKVFTDLSGEAKQSKEIEIKAANSVLKMMITYGKVIQDESKESVIASINSIKNNPDLRQGFWNEWATKMQVEMLCHVPLKNALLLLEGGTIEASLESAMTKGLDVVEADALRRFGEGFFRPTVMGLDTSVKYLNELVTRFEQLKQYDEPIEAFINSEQSKLKLAVQILDEYDYLINLLRKQSSFATAVHKFILNSPIIASFRNFTWSHDSGWYPIEQAGAAPIIFSKATAYEDLQRFINLVQSVERDNIGQLLGAAERVFNIRLSQLNQLNFLKKKLQAGQNTQTPAIIATQEKFTKLRAAFLRFYAPPQLRSSLSLLQASIPAELEARKEALFVSVVKTEDLFMQLSKP